MAKPELSVIVLVAESLRAMRPLLNALRLQNMGGRLELVVVSDLPLERHDPELADFANVTLVHHGVAGWSSRARACGVRAAQADLVAFSEDHCFPEPGWADAMLARFAAGNWAGVGPQFLNANPASLVSWLNFLPEYGCFTTVQGESRDIPGHNSVYRKQELLALGAALPEELQAETAMQWRMGRSGCRFYVEEKARVRHYNYSLWWPSLGLRFHGGWLFAANRVRGWPTWKRVCFALAAPLIPLVRFTRTCRPVPEGLRAVPFWTGLATFLAFDGLGEFFGYLTGDSERAMRYCTESEYQRQRFLRPEDRLTFA